MKLRFKFEFSKYCWFAGWLRILLTPAGTNLQPARSIISLQTHENGGKLR